MSRLDDLGDILDSYEGREFQKEFRSLFKNLYLIVDSSASITLEAFEHIKKGGRKAIEKVPDDGWCAVYNFSERGVYQSWSPNYSQDLLRFLDIYQGRGSWLEADKIPELREPDSHIEGNIAVLLVTDGEISTFRGIPELFQELNDKGYGIGVVCVQQSLPDDCNIPFDAIYLPKTDEDITESMEDFANWAFSNIEK